MLKILSIPQIRAADEYTIANEPIASIDLMERAAFECFSFIKEHLYKEKLIHVFCGMGNNGGDGLVIARMLFGADFNVQVFILKYASKYSDDFAINLERLKKETTVSVVELSEGSVLPNISEKDVVIDAIFGSGLSKPISGWLGEAISKINASNALVLAIDIPSGFFADTLSYPDKGAIIKADYTLTFQFPKKSFLFPECDAYVGDWQVLDIGLHPDYIHSVVTNDFYLTPHFIESIIKPRSKYSHKGTYGHALLIAGSYGMAGAAVLSAKAALRSGVGLLSLFIPKALYAILQTTVPEAMVHTSETDMHVSGFPDISKYTAIGMGPGIGKHDETAATLKLFIQQSSRPLVLDADALNILSENPTWLAFLPKNSILTPHPGEFERLAGKTSDSFERHQLQLEFSRKFHVIVVLKGAHTCITAPDGKAYFNSTGNPGMATGGSGDVLTGMITSLLAQSYSPLHAALLGVYLHGAAGDKAAIKHRNGLIARDIVEAIGRV